MRGDGGHEHFSDEGPNFPESPSVSVFTSQEAVLLDVFIRVQAVVLGSSPNRQEEIDRHPDAVSCAETQRDCPEPAVCECSLKDAANAHFDRCILLAQITLD